jgi:hypothetical protein
MRPGRHLRRSLALLAFDTVEKSDTPSLSRLCYLAMSLCIIERGNEYLADSHVHLCGCATELVVMAGWIGIFLAAWAVVERIMTLLLE